MTDRDTGEAAPVSETARTKARGGRGATVPDVEFRSYYGQPVLKEPVWTWEIPWYFFAGGLAGVSSLLAATARLAGRDHLARAARRVASVGALASPPLLVADLGRPERFFNMLRVFRPTSPMNMGSWLLAAYVPATTTAWLLGERGRFPELQRLAEVAAAALGAPLATYTAVLFADTSVPVWHEARGELPFVFAASSAASAGAAATVGSRGAETAPARRIAVGGAMVELAASRLMQQRLGPLGRPYREGRAGRWSNAAEVLTAVGGSLLALGSRRRWATVAGSGMLLAGAVATRWSVFRAGFQSAADPEATVAPQRARISESAG